MKGVIRTKVGYTGGESSDPTYRKLGGHAEAIQIDYDPEDVSYADLLEVFWKGHNPHSRPFSSQYRNAIFYHDDKQKKLAIESKEMIEKEDGAKVHTDISRMKRFYRAEDYHQKYYMQRENKIMKELKSAYPSFRGVVDSTAAARINGYLGGNGSCERLENEIGSLGLCQKTGADLLTRVCGSSATGTCGGRDGKCAAVNE